MPREPVPGERAGARPRVVLSIAGFDPSSGAGITADLQVFAAFGLFGTACITSLTVQSTRGVRAVQSVSGLMKATLAELEADLPADGVKIGMLGSAEAVSAVAAYLREREPSGPVVLDPVLVSSSGAPLLDAAGLAALETELLPLVDWITPNASELMVLAGDQAGTQSALQRLHARYAHLHIVVTDGESNPPEDVLLTPAGELHPFRGEHVETNSTHGTGCAFSSALLSRLVLGDATNEAVAAAKAYVTEALRSAPGLGHGRGPLNLLWPLRHKR